MPSELELSTVSDYVAAFHAGVRGKRDARADGRSGSIYDYAAGITAILLAREEAYARDLFRGRYYDDAEGDDLTDYVQQRYGIARILDTYGTGTMTLRRPTSAAGGDTIWEGTRVKVSTGPTTSAFYAVAADTPVSSSALIVAGVPLRATTYGAGVAVDSSAQPLTAAIDDPIWDPTFIVTNLRCADGTVFEKAHDFRARVDALLLEQALGYEPAIVDACQGIGAGIVAVFGTNVGGGDLGACAVYVGDAAFGSAPSLVPQATLALEAVRMLGPWMVTGTMVRTSLLVQAAITLYDDPSKFDLTTLAGSCESAVRRVFGATGAYSYDRDALFGAIVEVTDAIQDVAFTSPALARVGILTGSPPFFPPTLARYVIPPGGVTFTFAGPSG